MSDDIVYSLQTLCHPASEFLPDGKRLTLLIQRGHQAADEITRLRAELDAANARAAEGKREFQRYIKELDKITERAEAAEAREREATKLLKEAREYVREVAAVTLDEEDCEWLARIDAFLKGDE